MDSDNLSVTLDFVEKYDAKVFPSFWGIDKRTGNYTHLPKVAWSKYSSSNPEIIKGWAKKWPGCYFCVALKQSGLTVLDVDDKKNKNGSLSLLGLQIEHGLLPGTLTINTPSGGEHYIFTGISGQTTEELGSGLDTPGMVPLPGSYVKGKGEYTVIKNASIAPLPDWISKLLGKEKKKRSENPHIPAIKLDQPHNIAAAKKYLLTQAPIAIEGKGGDNTTYKTACKVREHGISELKCFDLMFQNWNNRCKPPWEPEDLKRKIANAYKYAQTQAGEKMLNPQQNNTPQGITAAELITKDFPEPKWAIPKILPEGLSVLGGKPKHGKSLQALNSGVSISSGKKAFGSIQVEQGTVVYLALEDTQRRLQKRLRRMLLPEEGAPEKLHLFTQWPRMDQGGLEALHQEIKKHSDLRLLIIDTLAKFKPVNQGRGSNVYDDDYQTVSAIKTLADEYSISILIIHHLRKSGADDIMDTFSGTLGLTGAADNLLVLERTTGSADAILHVTGRDVEPAEYALNFDSATLSWQILGNAREVKSTELRQTVFDAIKGQKGVVGIKDLVELTGMDYKAVQRQLSLLVKDGSVKKPVRGQYVYSGDNGGNEDIQDNADNGDKPLAS